MNLEASADTAGSLSFVPSVLKLLFSISKHNQLTNLEKRKVFELFWTYFRYSVGMLLWVEVHYVFSGIQRFWAEWDVQNNRRNFSGEVREKSLLLRPDIALLCAVERTHSCYREGAVVTKVDQAFCCCVSLWVCLIRRRERFSVFCSRITRLKGPDNKPILRTIW